MHYFITYMGTISTLQITRTALFKRVADRDSFGELSHIAKKILYLARSWNLGYAQTCRKLATLVPSRLFGDFLDRFAAMLDFGQDLATFLIEEQKVVLDDYETEYKKALENIKILQEVFISMTVAAGFMMAIAMLLPLIMGISIELVVRYSLIGIVIVDLFLYFFIKSIIPSDDLMHKMKEKCAEQKKLFNLFIFILPISLTLAGVLIYINKLPFLISVAIGLSPLMYVGYKGQDMENLIFARDKAYPSLVRNLGSVIEIKEGAVTSALNSMRVHDFGSLNDMVVHIYRRLRLGSNKFMCWELFSAESGSNMIQHFTEIFAESIYLGGNAEKIGEIVSDNFQRLLSLRRLRIQLAGGLKGAFYGSLVGFCASSYITAKIAETLSFVFSEPFQMAQEGSDLTGVFSSIMPAAPEINMSVILVYIGLMILVHSFISSMTVKIVDGGSKFSALYDFVIMVWIGAILSWIIPGFIGNILPQSSVNNMSLEEMEAAGYIFLLFPINWIRNKFSFFKFKRLKNAKS
jgi:flagellar protein FlaJ